MSSFCLEEWAMRNIALLEHSKTKKKMLKPERNPLCLASCLIKRYEAKNTLWQLSISQQRQVKP